MININFVILICVVYIAICCEVTSSGAHWIEYIICLSGKFFDCLWSLGQIRFDFMIFRVEVHGVIRYRAPSAHLRFRENAGDLGIIDVYELVVDEFCTCRPRSESRNWPFQALLHSRPSDLGEWTCASFLQTSYSFIFPHWSPQGQEVKVHFAAFWRGSIRTPWSLKTFEKRRNPAMFRPGPLIGARDLLRFLRKPPEASGDGAQ